MKKYLPFILLAICGCISAGAKLSGTGIDVHDPTHGIEVQANTINAEVNVATSPD